MPLKMPPKMPPKMLPKMSPLRSPKRSLKMLPQTACRITLYTGHYYVVSHKCWLYTMGSMSVLGIARKGGVDRDS